MSFDLGVFYTAKPLTDEAASERYAAYCSGGDLGPFIEPSPKVAAFVKELTGQYPQLHDTPEEELENCPWSVSFDVSEGHVVIGMTYFWAPDLTERIIGLAKKYGLVCYCPQSSEILTAPPALLSGKEAEGAEKKPAPEAPRKGRPSLEEVVSELSERLAGFGFVRRRKDEFIWKMNDQMTAYIGLNGRESRCDTELEPMIGLCHQGLTEFVHQYGKGRADWAIPLSYITNLRALTPRRRSVTPRGHVAIWRFGDGEGDDVARDIVAEIEAHAIPYLEAHDTLESLVAEILARNWGRDEAAVGLFLLGRYGEALTYLEAQLTEGAGDDDDFWKAYRSFALDLIDKMQADGLTIPDERQALLTSLTATPQPKGGAGEGGYFRERPFVELLDDLLSAQGFFREGLEWRKDSRHACITLTLDTGLFDRVRVTLDFRVFGRPDVAAPGYDPHRNSIMFLDLCQICPIEVALKLKRALCFYHDYAISGVMEHEPRFTERPRRKAMPAMQPDTPLTMEWRAAVLRQALTEHALPLFKRLQSNPLSRLKWMARSFVDPLNLGERRI